MGKKTYIFLTILALLVALAIYMKTNIQKNISGKVEGFSVIRVYDLLAPKVDLNVKFKVVNNSKFSFNVRNFKVRVFDVDTNQLLTENEVLQKIEIPIGESFHDTQLLGNEILGNLSDVLNSSGKSLRVEINFNAFLVNVKFEELITV